MSKFVWVVLGVGCVLCSCATPRSPSEEAVVQELLSQAIAGQKQWVNGSSQPAAERMAHAPTFTIFGPFGGPSPPGWSEETASAMAATARQFQGGTVDIQLVQSYVSGSLIVLVTIERNQVRFAGHEGLRKWELRVTQVYERDGSNWRVVHRHADPLIARRDFQETLELANR